MTDSFIKQGSMYLQYRTGLLAPSGTNDRRVATEGTDKAGATPHLDTRQPTRKRPLREHHLTTRATRRRSHEPKVRTRTQAPCQCVRAIARGRRRVHSRCIVCYRMACSLATRWEDAARQSGLRL